ncbi:heavy-metal-associated domain-containing protein [Mycobacterium yunnanensis]|uniref:Heavy-metal-associated domain-containing protein n=1 Tax=Mycobacterium yunnanensis TaxID=368477 RepID=A0A9X3BSA6_9MYCO|nr:cation transporter [Mycobacterium yunnanensis]MCV7419870.1 heavy-metal-associated domain-containing protein [Mycobacterium yunnanensis]
MSVLFEVHGMSCAHCVAAITSAVTPLPGVTSVDVALAEGTVRVEGTPDVDAVTAAIEDAGYDATAVTP